MNSTQPVRTTRPHTNWDLKLAAALFVGTCATMSLILPNWHEPLVGQADTSEVYQAQPRPQAPVPAPTNHTNTMNATPATNPRQQEAATEAYEMAQHQMRGGNYKEAATEFKKALEKFPDYADAYIGLGDAFTHLGDYQAAETNARHALSQLKLLKVGQAPDPHLKKELSYAHEILGIALLHLAKNDLDKHDMTSGKMKALEAASHCNLAAVFDQTDKAAQSCAKQAAALDTHS